MQHGRDLGVTGNRARLTELFLRDPQAVAQAAGMRLTEPELAILAATVRDSLLQMGSAVREQLPAQERRRFLELATAVTVALVAGGPITVSSAPERSRPHREPRKPGQISRPMRPIDRWPEEYRHPAPTGTPPDRRGCNR